MKRIALLTVLLLTIGLASAFAADPIVPIMSSVTAEVQWGINLDTGVNGFLNTPTFTIYLPIITYGSMSDKPGSGDFYGEIDLSNIELSIAYNVLPLNSSGTAFPAQVKFGQKVDTLVDATAASAASAFIVAKPWNMQFGVYAAPGMSLGHGIYLSQTDAVYGTLAPYATASTNPIVPANEDAAILTSPYGVYGTYVQYGQSTDPFMITVKALSIGSWKGDSYGIGTSAYAVGADGQLLFSPLTIGFGGYKGFMDASVWKGSPTQGYVTLGLAQPMGSMKVAADVKADFSLATAADYELSADAFLYISAANDKDGKPQYVNWVTANVLYGSPGTYNDLSLHFAAVEDGTNGFVPGLGLKVEGNIVNVIHGMAFDVIANASYAATLMDKVTLTPTAAFWFGQPVAPAVSLTHLIPTVTLDIKTVTNTDLAVVWTGGDLLAKKMGLGILNFNATITY